VYVAFTERFRILNSKVNLGQRRPEDVEERDSTSGLGLCENPGQSVEEAVAAAVSLLDGKRPQHFKRGCSRKASSSRGQLVIPSSARLSRGVPRTMSESVAKVKLAFLPTFRVDSPTKVRGSSTSVESAKGSSSAYRGSMARCARVHSCFDQIVE